MNAVRRGMAPLMAAACLVVVGSSEAVGQVELEVFSDGGDGFIETRATGGPWPAVHPSFDGSGGQGFFVNVGEWFGDGLTSGILPFQLPDVGPVADPFLSANLGVHVFERGTASPLTSVDLYGIRTASTPELLASDYYSGSAFDTTPGVVLIQEDFFTDATQAASPAEPNVFTNGPGDAALLSYLNSAYAGGVGAGDFVFLRLSYGADAFATSFDAFKITSRNAGGGEGDFPVIALTVDVIPGDSNNDGSVDLVDYAPIRDNWLQTNESLMSTLTRADGDLDADGAVGVTDFREWKDAFLAGGGTTAQVAAAFAQLRTTVPEPGAMAAAALAVLGVAVRRQRPV